MPNSRGVETLRHTLRRWKERRQADAWIRGGRKPGRRGDTAAKWMAVERALAGAPAKGYGYDDAGLDERVVEYPWAFERLSALHTKGAPLLDAGSVLNHPRMLAHCRRAGHHPLSIVTLRYEGDADVSDEVRYEFADLRTLPYRDEWFANVVSLSTLEHVGMDNSMYGDDASSTGAEVTRELGRAMQELRRVTKPGGTALISVPFGARSNRGWLRIFDESDLTALTQAPGWRLVQSRIFRAMREGWRESSPRDARDAGYNDPRNPRFPGVERTAPAWVSAAEAVALVEISRV